MVPTEPQGSLRRWHKVALKVGMLVDQREDHGEKTSVKKMSSSPPTPRTLGKLFLPHKDKTGRLCSREVQQESLERGT